MSTYGETLSIKFWLNKTLKPVIENSIKRFPVYVQVIYQRKKVSFKYFDSNLDPLFLSDEEILNKRGLDEDIISCLSFSTHYKTEKFTIENLPIILREYYTVESLFNSYQKITMLVRLVNNGFYHLAEVIDWNGQMPFVIDDALVEIGKRLSFKSGGIDISDLKYQWLFQLIEDMRKNTSDDIVKRLPVERLKIGSNYLTDVSIKYKDFRGIDSIHSFYDKLPTEIVGATVRFLKFLDKSTKK